MINLRKCKMSHLWLYMHGYLLPQFLFSLKDMACHALTHEVSYLGETCCTNIFQWLWWYISENGHQGYLRKIRHLKQISFTQLYDKKRFLLHFNPVRVWVLTIVVEDVTFFLLLFTCFILFFFSGIFKIYKLHNCVEEICLLNNSYHGNGKETVIITTVTKRIKYFLKSMNLIQLSWLDKH